MKNRKRGNRDSSKAGFTIVELLVAIGVFTIATGIIVGVFIEALKTQRRIIPERATACQFYTTLC